MKKCKRHENGKITVKYFKNILNNGKFLLTLHKKSAIVSRKEIFFSLPGFLYRQTMEAACHVPTGLPETADARKEHETL